MDEFISSVMVSITSISLCILIVPEYSSHCIWILSSSLHSLFGTVRRYWFDGND